MNPLCLLFVAGAVGYMLGRFIRSGVSSCATRRFIAELKREARATRASQASFPAIRSPYEVAVRTQREGCQRSVDRKSW